MRRKTWISLAIVLLVAGPIAWLLVGRLQDGAEPSAGQSHRQPVPVEAIAIEHGPIELRRSFSGTLEAAAEFVVAPKVSGRIEQISVDLADTVTRGQVVARLDNEEYVQEVRRAEADLAVARANLAEAKSQLVLSTRELERNESLRERGLGSESQLDTARADQLAKQAQLAVGRAQLARAEADMESARIRLGYTEITAGWHGGGEQRVVAERYVDEGETVSANSALLRIVELDPVTAVFHVTEQEYARLNVGQAVNLATDAYPGERFEGRIVRIAPVFRENTRQARVELGVDNPDLRLKPGMFVRTTVVLDREPDAVIVPESALAKREGRTGVFVVTSDNRSVSWVDVQTGIREGNRVQVLGELPDARVVTLGQHLLEDGSAISIAGDAGASRQ